MCDSIGLVCFNSAQTLERCHFLLSLCVLGSQQFITDNIHSHTRISHFRVYICKTAVIDNAARDVMINTLPISLHYLLQFRVAPVSHSYEFYCSSTDADAGCCFAFELFFPCALYSQHFEVKFYPICVINRAVYMNRLIDCTNADFCGFFLVCIIICSFIQYALALFVGFPPCICSRCCINFIPFRRRETFSASILHLVYAFISHSLRLTFVLT